MSSPEPRKKEQARPAPDQTEAEAAGKNSSGRDSSGSAAGDPPNSETLTPDEQMARYEESLKDEDWGHQPC